MKSKVSSINSLVLVLVAFSSLVSMFAVTRIDRIVHRDLYNYGLTFSYKWAMPYWTMTTIVFATGWFNIIIASAFQFYVLLYGRKKAEEIPQREAVKTETSYQPPIEEKAEEPKPQEIKPAESGEKETIAPSMEVEVETWKEGEEAPEPTEETVIVVEEKGETETLVETPQEYIEETEQPEQIEEQKEPAEPTETTESPTSAEETHETEEWRERETESTETTITDVPLREEQPLPTEETPQETVETESQTPQEEETPTSAPTEEHETSTEETQQQEAEVAESYST